MNPQDKGQLRLEFGPMVIKIKQKTASKFAILLTLNNQKTTQS